MIGDVRSGIQMHLQGMSLRCPLLLLILCCCCVAGSAQQRTVFIIDTLVFGGTDFDVSHRTLMEIPSWMYVEPVAGKITPAAYPNYKAEFEQMAGLPIKVPLTQDGGVLEIHISDSIGRDTIRIRKFEVLASCAWDSASSTVVWRRLSDTTDVITRVDHSVRSVNPDPCKSFVPEIRLNINGVDVVIPIRPKENSISAEVMHFHGYKPRKCGGMSNGDRGYRRCLRMDGSSYTNGWRLYGEVHLQ